MDYIFLIFYNIVSKISKSKLIKISLWTICTYLVLFHSRNIIIAQENGSEYYENGIKEFYNYHYDNALNYFETSLKSGYDNEMLHLYLCQIYNNRNKYTDAMAECKRAMDINPKLADAHCEWAKAAYFGEKLLDPAIRHLRMATIYQGVKTYTSCISQIYLASFTSIKGNNEKALKILDDYAKKPYANREMELSARSMIYIRKCDQKKASTYLLGAMAACINKNLALKDNPLFKNNNPFGNICYDSLKDVNDKLLNMSWKYSYGFDYVYRDKLNPDILGNINTTVNPDQKHILVSLVQRGSPAENNGLQINDIILEINDKIYNIIELMAEELNNSRTTGKTIKIRIMRGDKLIDIVMAPKKTCNYGSGWDYEYNPILTGGSTNSSSQKKADANNVGLTGSSSDKPLSQKVIDFQKTNTSDLTGNTMPTSSDMAWGGKEIGNIYCESVIKGSGLHDIIDIMDMQIFKKHYPSFKLYCTCPKKCENESCYAPYADTNSDGIIDILDLTTIKKNFGKTVGPSPKTIPKDANGDPVCGDN